MKLIWSYYIFTNFQYKTNKSFSIQRNSAENPQRAFANKHHNPNYLQSTRARTGQKKPRHPHAAPPPPCRVFRAANVIGKIARKLTTGKSREKWQPERERDHFRPTRERVTLSGSPLCFRLSQAFQETMRSAVIRATGVRGGRGSGGAGGGTWGGEGGGWGVGPRGAVRGVPYSAFLCVLRCGRCSVSLCFGVALVDGETAGCAAAAPAPTLQQSAPCGVSRKRDSTSLGDETQPLLLANSSWIRSGFYSIYFAENLIFLVWKITNIY